MRCPVCKADNAGGPACRRCKADLAPLLAVEARRAWELAAARRALAEGAGAHGHAARADGLRRDEESLAMRAAAALLGRDYAEAWRCYQRLSAAASAGPRPNREGSAC